MKYIATVRIIQTGKIKQVKLGVQAGVQEACSAAYIKAFNSNKFQPDWEVLDVRGVI